MTSAKEGVGENEEEVSINIIVENDVLERAIEDFKPNLQEITIHLAGGF